MRDPGGTRDPGGAPREVVLLGSTGSIGIQTLEIVAAHPDRFRVVGLAAGSDDAELVAQAREHGVRRVALADAAAANRAREALGGAVEVLAGDEGVEELAGTAGPDATVLIGVVGSRGLAATLAALAAGSRVALANKESLVVGGRLVLDAASAGQLVPVDSEHSALAQCLRAGTQREVERLVVTASGGPFRGRSRTELADVTVEEALAHPTWSMGPVITVSSATLANKGLEVIEAHLLFDLPYDRIEVVVHPQSVVHSMVEFCDGSTIAQLTPPDMRLPIQLALGWPQRLPHAPTRMDWSAAQALEFEPVDLATFRVLDLAYAAGRRGGSAPAAFNAANEEAVRAFLDGHLAYLAIEDVIDAVLASDAATDRGEALEPLLAAEAAARRVARERIAVLAG